MPTRAPAQFPVGTVRLVEAFTTFFQTVTPNWKDMENALANAVPVHLDAPAKAKPVHKRLKAKWRRQHKIWRAAERALDDAVTAAEIQFRKAAASGHPASLIQDPQTGQVKVLGAADWDGKQNLIPGFSDDFISRDEGPDTFIAGIQCPVFFDLEEMRRFIDSQRGGPPRRSSAGIPSWKPDLEAYMDQIAHSGRAKVIGMLALSGYSEKRRPSQGEMAKAVRTAFLKENMRAKPDDVAAADTIIRDYKPRLRALLAAGFPTKAKK
jgi:hypothetical protein